MTNKLEEVFKELQESHVLVEKEEYERLVEKAKESENEEIKLEVGGYYSDGKRIYKMLKLGTQDNYISSFSFELCCFAKNISCGINGNFFKGLRKATDEEIKLFKRAEMYHKHGRKLDELKIGDLLIDKGDSCEIYQVEEHHGALEYVEDIIAGLVVTEIYLTVEEQQEAYKKIVGE